MEDVLARGSDWNKMISNGLTQIILWFCHFPSSSHSTGCSTHSTALPVFLGYMKTTRTSNSFNKDLVPSFQLTKQERL